MTDAWRSDYVREFVNKNPGGTHLCLGCLNDIDRADCHLVHLNDGLPALSGHWWDGELCGPVVQIDREPNDLTPDFLERWKAPSIN